MSNPQKRKGSDFERLTAELLNKLVKKSIWKRIPSSGAIGTIMLEPGLTSDVKGKVESIPQEFKVECKVGYNSSKVEGVKQFVLKKEWLDKNIKEAAASYGIPILIGKFGGVKEGVKVFAVMDIEVFANLINRITELNDELDKSTSMRINLNDREKGYVEQY